MKKLKLKENVKLTLLLTVFIVIGVALTQLYIKRIEEINQGTFIVINDNEMDK